MTFYIEPEHVAAVKQYLEDNDVYIRHEGDDWIEALVPPALLATPPNSPASGAWIPSSRPTPTRARAEWSARAWPCTMPTTGTAWATGAKAVGVIDGGFKKFREAQSNGELPANVTARCYPPRDSQEPVSLSVADCEVDSEHGTWVAETVIDVAPEVELYIAHPQSGGDFEDAVDWMIENGVQVINRSQGGRGTRRWHVLVQY